MLHVRVSEQPASMLTDLVPSFPAATSHKPASAAARGPRVLQGRVWLGGRDLLQPVEAQLEVLGVSAVSATERQTGIFGAGDDVAAALEDLRSALREHLELLETESQLSEELEAQRAFLRSHLRPAA